MYPQFEGQNNYLNSSINMSYFIKFNWITQCLIDYRTLLLSFIVIIIYHFLLLNSHVRPLPHPRGGGGYSHILPIQVCAAQRGRDFEAPDLERGIHFRGIF